MPNQVLPGAPSTIPKGPTATDLRACVAQQGWLDVNINWKRLRRYGYSLLYDAVTCDMIVQELYDDMLQWTLEELQSLHVPQVYARTALRHRVLNWLDRDDRPDFTDSLSDEHNNIADGGVSL